MLALGTPLAGADNGSETAPRFGFNYWPQGYGSEALADANWAQLRPVVEADLDHMASLGGRVLRLVFWPQLSGWTIDPTTFAVTFDQVDMAARSRNLLELLRMARARRMSVILCFSNNWFELDHHEGTRWWELAYPSFSAFLKHSVAWVNAYVQPVRNSFESPTILYYDYESEYSAAHPNIGRYLTTLYDLVPVSPGQRGLSVLRVPEDLDHLIGSLGNRPLDYIDFHSYPYGPVPPLNPDIPGTIAAIKLRLPAARLLLGEFGWQAEAEADEAAQSDTVLAIATVARQQPDLTAYLHWTLWDRSPYTVPPLVWGWAYEHDRPKDVLGTMAATSSALANSDMEQTSSDKPAGWTADGTVPVDLTAMGPAGDAATNALYARVHAAQPGIIWLMSATQPVSSSGTAYVNAYVRSNMNTVYLQVREYDALGQVIRLDRGPSVHPPGWRFWSYLHAAGSFHVLLTPNTRSVALAVVGDGGAPGDVYLDVDAVSMDVH